tara:strand:+ start:85 stop:306 length:222 start_codon:yes stop_codon:yes gene_type:complete
MGQTKRAKEIAEIKPYIIDYYFNNPHANGYKHMREKFGVTDSTIRLTIEEELDRRFKNAQRVKNVQKNKEIKE